MRDDVVRLARFQVENGIVFIGVMMHDVHVRTHVEPRQVDGYAQLVQENFASG